MYLIPVLFSMADYLHTRFGKKLWSLKLPGKIKKILWRCLHNAIPCLCILANRHIGSNSQCPICSVGAKNIMHALFRCPCARLIWKALGLAKEVADASLVDWAGSVVIDFLLCDQSAQRLYLDTIKVPELFATPCWYIWWQRRQLVRGEQVQTPKRTSPAIYSLALNFVRAKRKMTQVPRMK